MSLQGTRSAVSWPMSKMGKPLFCDDKMAFSSESQASFVAWHMSQDGRADFGYYLCDCGWYHLTTAREQVLRRKTATPLEVDRWRCENDGSIRE